MEVFEEFLWVNMHESTITPQHYMGWWGTIMGLGGKKLPRLARCHPHGIKGVVLGEGPGFRLNPGHTA